MKNKDDEDREVVEEVKGLENEENDVDELVKEENDEGVDENDVKDEVLHEDEKENEEAEDVVKGNLGMENAGVVVDVEEGAELESEGANLVPEGEAATAAEAGDAVVEEAADEADVGVETVTGAEEREGEA